MNEFDNDFLTYEDIRPGIRQGRGKVVGYSKNKNGTMSRITKFEEYYKTNVGVLTVSDWTELAKKVIVNSGDEALYRNIFEYVIKYPWLKQESKSEIECYACECLLSGAYKHWQEFKNEER